MAGPLELSGVAIVAAGSFNPAIFQPRWFAQNELILENEAEHALGELLVSRQLSAFSADWLSVQVTLDQAVFSTVEEARAPDLRNVAKGVFELLPHTPTNAIGINTDAHYRIGSEEEWHEIGDRFLPKDQWEPLFTGDDWKRRSGAKVVGVRTMTVEAWRENGRDFLQIELAPSTRLRPWGVYVAINGHFQLSVDDERGTGYDAARTIDANWERVLSFERELQEQIMEWVP